MDNPFDEINKRLERIEAYLREPKQTLTQTRIGGIELAMEITGLSREAIYKLVQKRQIPYSKPTGTRNLRFDEQKLRDWYESGYQKTEKEIIEEPLLKAS